jgi:signal transduction histidine kinase
VEYDFDELEVWELIATRVFSLATALTVTISMPLPQDLARIGVLVAVGAGSTELVGQHYPAAGSIAGLALSESEGQLNRGDLYCVHDLVLDQVGAVMAVPLTSSNGVRGAMVVSRRPDQDSFTSLDLSMASNFASRAVLALERAEARSARMEHIVVEERERIARDLHDHVIQSLFATGLNLAATLNAIHEHPDGGRSEVATRTEKAITALDTVIREIRNTIFDLKRVDPGAATPRAATSRVVESLVDLHLPLHVTFTGPVDRKISNGLVGDLTAVLHEALVNAHRHARATRVHLNVDQQDHQLVVTVTDNGTGLSGRNRRSGLANLRSRAARAGGTFTLDTAPGGGLKVRWTAPDGASR